MNKLEEIAIAAREQLLNRNVFNNFDKENNYSSEHTRAKSDEETPIHGKGTGIPFDSKNGGGSYDIYGHPNFAGSGRIGNTAINKYNEETGYKTPDTSGNVGQVKIK